MLIQRLEFANFKVNSLLGQNLREATATKSEPKYLSAVSSEVFASS